MADTAVVDPVDDTDAIDEPPARPGRETARRAGSRKLGITLIVLGIVGALVGAGAYVSASSARTGAASLEAERQSLERESARLTDSTLADALRATDVDAFSVEIINQMSASRTARERVEEVFSEAVEAVDRGRTTTAQNLVDGDVAVAVEAERTVYDQLAATVAALGARLDTAAAAVEAPAPEAPGSEPDADD